MEIELKKITVRELIADYEDLGDEGVTAYGGRLDVRPPYQREFVYKDQQRNAVIDTLASNFPLNSMYWVVRNDNRYEIIDGQQRTISICRYIKGDFSHMIGDFSDDPRYFHNLQDDEQQQILDYTLMIYHCRGTNKEKLKWFETINIAGEELSSQELRNAVYHGAWVSNAKRYFSKPGCAAQDLGKDYLKGSTIRQEYLETAIKWIIDKESVDSIEEYMAKHQNHASAEPLWNYFENVISWVNRTFPQKRSQMKGLDWGIFYNKFGDESLDSDLLEKEIARLMEDEDVQKKSGIYEYVLTRDERSLNLRSFSNKVKTETYERQGRKCAKCEKEFAIDEMEADHIDPWTTGGKTISENCQMLCRPCNRRKSAL